MRVLSVARLTAGQLAQTCAIVAPSHSGSFSHKVETIGVHRSGLDSSDLSIMDVATLALIRAARPTFRREKKARWSFPRTLPPATSC